MWPQTKANETVLAKNGFAAGVVVFVRILLRSVHRRTLLRDSETRKHVKPMVPAHPCRSHFGAGDDPRVAGPSNPPLGANAKIHTLRLLGVS